MCICTMPRSHSGSIDAQYTHTKMKTKYTHTKMKTTKKMLNIHTKMKTKQKRKCYSRDVGHVELERMAKRLPIPRRHW